MCFALIQNFFFFAGQMPKGVGLLLRSPHSFRPNSANRRREASPCSNTKRSYSTPVQLHSTTVIEQ
jgi:hypothetical protein